MKKLVFIIVLVCFSILFHKNLWAESPHHDRAPYKLSQQSYHGFVIFKFNDDLTVRLRDQQLQGIDAQSQKQIQNILGAYQIKRLFKSKTEEEYVQQRKELQKKSGKKLADKNLYFYVAVPEADEAWSIVQQLDSLSVIKTAYMEARPVNPASSSTPSYQGKQYYLESNASEGGINAKYAWTIDGGTGLNVKIADLENGWNLSHEDLPADISIGYGESAPASDYPDAVNHGTAVLGILVAQNNGFGMTGIAYDSNVSVFSWYDEVESPVVPAINEAIDSLTEGDVILLEGQIPGPSDAGDCSEDDSDGCVSMEWETAYFDVIQFATAEEIIVIEAAGNGNNNLDNFITYGKAFYRDYQDSGAIIVGAGSADIDHSRLLFSNYGDRVDVQGWGEDVATLGKGDLAYSSFLENREYTDTFNGTSSAAAIVAGAVASIQGAYKEYSGGSVILPYAMRELLTSTGTPQTGTENIGPLPNLEDAIDAFLYDASYMADVSSTSTSSDGGGTWGEILKMSVSISDSEATFTVAKTSFDVFSSSGDLYLQVGSPDSGAVYRDPICEVTAGETYSCHFTDYLFLYDDSTFSGGKEYYARFESDSGGYATVGPITIVIDSPGGTSAKPGDDSEDDEEDPTPDTDTDGDGLEDWIEEGIGTDPNDTDTDNDGLSDGWEVENGESPTLADGDGDGLDDGEEINLGTSTGNSDSDGDGLEDGEEVELGTDPLDEDSDDDGVSDSTDPNPLYSSTADSDSDGLVDEDEVDTYGTNPLDSDSDNDGLSDYIEAVTYGKTNPVTLTASDAYAGDYFGSAVAIDGDVAVISAPLVEEAGSSLGAVYVFRHDGSVWNEEAKLTVSDVSEYVFANSIAVSGDKIIIGASKDDAVAAESGSVYIFSWDGSAWNQEEKLTPSDASAGDRFGTSVDIDGDTIVVGASGDDVSKTDSGSVYIYTWDGSSWGNETKINLSTPDINDEFGTTVALDDDVIAVGVPSDDPMGSASGSVALFRQSETSWAQETTLYPSDGAASEYFGNHIALDNNRLVVGSDYHAVSGVKTGLVYVYKWDGSWSEEAQLSLSDGAEKDFFGKSVSINDKTIVVGASGDDHDDGTIGSVTVFVYDNSSWSEFQKIKVSDVEVALSDIGANTNFYMVATDGKNILIGQNKSDITWMSDAGAAHVFGVNHDVLNPNDADTDDDGLSDEEEINLGTSPYFSDYDEDSLDDITEIALGTNPNNADSDNDGLDDDIEVALGTNPNHIDTDGDGMNDATDTDPLGSDIDADGIGDIYDLCPSTLPFREEDTVNSNGCSLTQLDSDSDGLTDFEETVSEASLRTTEIGLADASASDMFGFSTATDGTNILIGAYGNDENGTNSGKAAIFTWENYNWTETTLTPSDPEAGAYFGYAVALDEKMAVVGAIYDDGPGSASLFYNDGTSWNEEFKLSPSDGASGDRFGTSVALDNDVVVIGAPRNDEGATNAGAVYVYRFDGTTWNEEAKLMADSPSASDLFGFSVSISGNVILVGAPNDDHGSITDTGSVFVYRYNGTSWALETSLSVSDESTKNYFGSSVSLDGTTAVVGAYGNSTLASSAGAVYVYQWDGSLWNEETKLTAGSGKSGDYLGNSVSISDDNIFIGAPYRDQVASQTGSTFLYGLDGTEWVEKSEFVADSATKGDLAGYSVSIKNNLAVSGAYSRDQSTDVKDVGTVFVYDFSETALTDPNNPDTDGDGFLDGEDENPLVSDVTTYTVTNTADTNDGKCNTDCSLREALALSKTDTSTKYVVIKFDIPSTDTGCSSSGVCTISPAKALPSLTRGFTTLDGSTNGLNRIVIDGTSAGSTTKGLTINSSSSNIITGLVIQNFGNHGIYITGSASSDNEISNCLIGVDETGADQSNAGSGIYITSGSAEISKNTIAYNAKKGVHLSSTSALGIIITQNSMHDNVSYGITLASSANNNKAKPVISAATVSGSTVTITGTSTAGDTIEVFNASTDSEGQTYIGETTADSSGNWSYVTNTTTAPKWSKLVATGTDSTNGTSPFSATKTVK